MSEQEHQKIKGLKGISRAYRLHEYALTRTVHKGEFKEKEALTLQVLDLGEESPQRSVLKLFDKDKTLIASSFAENLDLAIEALNKKLPESVILPCDMS